MKNSMSLLALALAGAAAPALAQGFADPAQIDREVAAFLGVPASEAGSAFMPVDRRLRLAQCAQPLAMDWQGTRRDTVLVQCPGVWKIYVRTAGQAGAPAVDAVKRGQPVSVSVRGSGFTVSQTAQALENGGVGDWVRGRGGKGAEGPAPAPAAGGVPPALYPPPPGGGGGGGGSVAEGRASKSGWSTPHPAPPPPGEGDLHEFTTSP